MNFPLELKLRKFFNIFQNAKQIYELVCFRNLEDCRESEK